MRTDLLLHIMEVRKILHTVYFNYSKRVNNVNAFNLFQKMPLSSMLLIKPYNVKQHLAPAIIP